jgi:hypothetical protein
MGLGLTNARLTPVGGRRLRTQKVAPARTSIAEDAKFITKPHKRVRFKVTADYVVMGGNGSHIRQGQLGRDGLTARFDAEAYGGRPPLVVTEIDYTPQKDYGVIAIQEEGRQTNRAAYTHYTQQYDSYGRPIIGFSREPYDFAATKYVSITSQIKFQENMEKTRELYNERSGPLLNGDVYDLSLQEAKYLGTEPPPAHGMIDPDPELPVKGMIEYNPEDLKLPGSGSVPKEGMKDGDSAGKIDGSGSGNEKEGETFAIETTGKSAVEVAEMMGMEFMKVLKPGSVEDIANLHGVKNIKSASVSLTV